MKHRVSDIEITVTFLLILLVPTSWVLWGSLNPTTSDAFMAISTLGENGALGSYFPESNTVTVGQNMSWRIDVYNHMFSDQFVSVRLKLLNASMIAPDEMTNSPSPYDAIVDIRHVLLSNETWEIPLSWYISNATEYGNSFRVKSISFDSNVYNVDLLALNGSGFRLIIELWVFSTDAQQFEFSWLSNGQPHSAWNEIWFVIIQGNH